MHPKYEIVIGLEVHVKLRSETKLFCGCANEQDFDGLEANVNICPVCTGQPGALPVLQPDAFMKGLQLGLALNCTIQDKCYFDRKSYFYPDLPMGYQITQHEKPVNIQGKVSYRSEDYSVLHSARIHQAHLECDAAKMTHEGGKAYLDFNRSATPLIEIVTDPDFNTPEEVVNFLKEIQRIVRYNDIGDADMEKGQMRADVNISLKPIGSSQLGTKVEIKNMNSFGSIKRAIEYEFARQAALLDSEQKIIQETRGWDDEKEVSYTMRTKENALDYRYFPEPDLPPVRISEDMMNSARSTTVESPAMRVKKYKEAYGFNKELINGILWSSILNTWFEHAVHAGIDPFIAAKRIAIELGRYLEGKEERIAGLLFGETTFLQFLEKINNGSLIKAHAKQVLRIMVDTGKEPSLIIHEHGFIQLDTDEIENIIEEVIFNNPTAVNDFQNGEQKSLGFLIGQAMKASQGKGNPKIIREILLKKLQ